MALRKRPGDRKDLDPELTPTRLTVRLELTKDDLAKLEKQQPIEKLIRANLKYVT